MLLGICTSFVTFAQNRQKVTDSVYHYEDKFLYKQQLFYNKWNKKAQKHKWSKELFNVLFDYPTATTPKNITKKK
ncbi:MAG: hypothetical protein KGV44_13900 [Flavobacteriaceae bacterium]|nr:hypothetical protein [Flavobacteriaceae bacterium]